jgi:Glycosyltransferase family 87
MVSDRWGGRSRQLSLSVIAGGWRTWGPLVSGAAVMICGLAIHWTSFAYHGASTQRAFNSVAFAHLGAYSDISSLYIRNHMWQHALPYTHYQFEYPVGTGLFAWLTSLPGGGVAGFMALNSVALLTCGLATIWLLGRFPRANPWLLALSPTLALYVVLNWDLLSIVALVLCLWLFQRRRDAWSGVALGMATWTKFFPIIALPVLLAARLLEDRDTPLSERGRAVARILLPFAAVTVVANVPFLLSGGSVASNWFYFFRFNAWRGVGGSLWSLVSAGHMTGATANADSAILTLAGLAVIFSVFVWAYRCGGRSNELVTLTLLACFAWFFFAIKTYSPQYDLWVMVFLALAGAPLTLGIAFSAADVGYFVIAFTWLRISPKAHWFLSDVLHPAVAIKTAMLFVVAAWAIWSIVRPRLSATLPVVEPERPFQLAGLTNSQE